MFTSSCLEHRYEMSKIDALYVSLWFQPADPAQTCKSVWEIWSSSSPPVFPLCSILPLSFLSPPTSFSPPCIKLSTSFFWIILKTLLEIAVFWPDLMRDEPAPQGRTGTRTCLSKDAQAIKKISPPGLSFLLVISLSLFLFFVSLLQIFPFFNASQLIMLFFSA